MKNRLGDLNNHLFEQLERLNNDTLTEEQLVMEAERTRHICAISGQIINNARVVLDAHKAISGGNIRDDGKGNGIHQMLEAPKGFTKAA
jgi:hypothetical protein